MVSIDPGMTKLMAEDLTSGFVWETFMHNPEAIPGAQKAGFHPVGR